ncbi:glycosyltransferase [Marinobacterium mangrovicola]|uniref:Glycosyltransferase involved in cell wall biosynthesis n=1 Tax=Marinobacterium mangrovicola TaxID=1476959 RepID=A0A4R1GLW7_9GAMM|nr:glycosyltransferase [Marinobacterium mangrovicola]TCK09288.1 glycosyltransferase involved in cell wall biosynthesis [Marinobacterium mangrovicola]
MNNSPFYQDIRSQYEQFLSDAAAQLNPSDTLRIDLHCHDHNSDVPDEIWGRLLRLPETWLSTEELSEALNRAGTDVVTITNHNNARSCWSLTENQKPVLSGCEFTCHFPGEALSIHVLIYGFTPKQELELHDLRHDIYAFCAYARQHDLPTVLPHPLFFYSHGENVDPTILERFALLFERFEVLNGQRGYWQNLLTLRWVESLTPDKIDTWAAKHGINPHDFCRDPYRKNLSGGSDDHNGLFAGRCGTLLEVPNLQARLAAGESREALALDAIREGRMAPYGFVGEEEKMTTAFLDYFAQVVINMKDPGLLRMLLHKGSLKDRMICLALSNLLQELKRHKYTLTFLDTFHQALKGKKPKMLLNLGVSKEFKPILKIIKRIAKTQRTEPERFPEELRQSIPELHRFISHTFFNRVHDELGRIDKDAIADIPIDEMVRMMEVPTHFRALFSSEKSNGRDMTQVNLGQMLDKLTFPALSASVVAGAAFASTQVLYSNRAFLDRLAADIGATEHPKRVLWLTDTLVDRNGVSSALRDTLTQLQKADLPIDLLVCHPSLKPQPHLQVIRPLTQFQFNQLGEQTIHVPDLLEVQKLFERGGYDRIICSTELCMGPVALYLKRAYSVPAWFYMHTDWLEFISRKTRLDQPIQDRIRRLIRAFYQQFDGMFVLNEEHRDWLTGPDMELPEERIKLTAHWAGVGSEIASLQPRPVNEAPILLYVGRLSEEKGVLDLPAVWERVKREHPDAQLWIAGSGPAEQKLREAAPEATYFGWLEQSQVPQLYQQADLLLLPSRFDTFGCVILEAMSAGLPTLAYNCKGPRSIIQHRLSGLLADDGEEMAELAVEYLASPDKQGRLRVGALSRCLDYSPQKILSQLLEDMGLQTGQKYWRGKRQQPTATLVKSHS